jgi:hypothetical protein
MQPVAQPGVHLNFPEGNNFFKFVRNIIKIEIMLGGNSSPEW